MDDGSLQSLLLIIFLTALHALVTLAYSALSTNPATYLQDEAEKGSRRANRVIALNEDLPRLSLTVQIVTLLLRMTIFAIATLMVRQPLLALPDVLRAVVVPPISYAVVLIPLALLIFLLSSLIPAVVGRARADAIAPWAALPMRVLVTTFRPLVAVMQMTEKTLQRVSGGSNVVRTVADEEIRSLMDEKGGVIEVDEKEMIRSVLEFGETIAREVMVPRLDVTALELQSTIAEALAEFVSSGHSRIPVYDDNIDNVKGVLYAKDLLDQWLRNHDRQKTVAEMMRPAYFVPETKRADALFKELQERKVHLAVIVDEYGGTAGLVTIEDLIEEIVGDIQDEFDTDEVALFEFVREGEYLFDGSINLDDFNDLMDTDLSTEDNDTLGGFIFGLIGSVPEVNQELDVPEDRLHMQIESVEGRRIRRVHVTKLPPQSETEPAATGTAPEALVNLPASEPDASPVESAQQGR